MEVQTRNEEGELRYLPSVTEAFEHAEKDLSVWKISWTDVNGKRVRLVRRSARLDHGDWKSVWQYEPIERELREVRGSE